ncbi:MAG: hypothetical protein NTV05_15410 [Acidobacteria bacterium]|nr:hypothetical protein [Acidobacteriota bacterium]
MDRRSWLKVAAGLSFLQGQVLLPGVASHVVFLSAGIAYLGGAVLNWKASKGR